MKRSNHASPDLLFLKRKTRRRLLRHPDVTIHNAIIQPFARLQGKKVSYSNLIRTSFCSIKNNFALMLLPHKWNILSLLLKPSHLTFSTTALCLINWRQGYRVACITLLPTHPIDAAWFGVPWQIIYNNCMPPNPMSIFWLVEHIHFVRDP